MVSDESTIDETSQPILLVIYCISSLILFAQLKMSLQGRGRSPGQAEKLQFSPITFVEETI